MLLRSLMQEKFKAEPMKMRTVTPGGTSHAFEHVDTPIVEKQAGNTSSIRKASTVTTTTVNNWFILNQRRWWNSKWITNDDDERRLKAMNTSSTDQQLLSTPNAKCGPCSAEISAKRTPKTSFSKQDRHWNMLCNLFCTLFAYLLSVVPSPYSSFTHIWIL